MKKRQNLKKSDYQTHMWSKTYDQISPQVDVHLFYRLQSALQDVSGYLLHVQLYLKLQHNEFGQIDEND